MGYPMNLQQFRFVRETIRRNFNLTDAARALYTSQPGVSKAIMEFEQELGVQIFERHGKRIKGLTKPGQAVAQVVDRINREVENLKKVSDEYAKRDQGSLVIACTHTQARYALPKVIPAFRAQFPKVRLAWHPPLWPFHGGQRLPPSHRIDDNKDPKLKYKVEVSYMEIYNEKVPSHRRAKPVLCHACAPTLPHPTLARSSRCKIC
jgi:hypothetical protein